MGVATAACGNNHLVSAESVREALADIAQSDLFARSPQLYAFLRFIVEEELAGRGERIKGYTIAVQALGRSNEFDPNNDPIVRVEARRLRQALATYYAGQGACDAILISLPTGTYRPAFLATPKPTPEPLPLPPETVPDITVSPARSRAYVRRLTVLVVVNQALLVINLIAVAAIYLSM